METYRVIATATANQTYKNQILYLQTYYNGLSFVEKMKSIILVGDYVYRYSRVNCYAAIRSNNSFKITIYAILMTGSNVRFNSKELGATGIDESVDMVDQTNTGTMQLIIVN